MAGWQLLRWWRAGDEWLLPALRQCFAYEDRWPDRATGWLWLPHGSPPADWPPPFADLGPQLLMDLKRDTGATFTACCFQAYRDGAGCGWHHDRGWGGQAVLSLGVTRRFGLRRETNNAVFLSLAHGDLLVMPQELGDEWEHCVPVEDVPGERCSLVFRSPRQE